MPDGRKLLQKRQMRHRCSNRQAFAFSTSIWRGLNLSVSYPFWRGNLKKRCHTKAFKIQNDPTRSVSLINLFGLGRVIHFVSCEHYSSTANFGAQTCNPAKRLRVWTKKDLCCRGGRALRGCLTYKGHFWVCQLNTTDQFAKIKNQNANQRSVCILERRSDEAGERWLFWCNA